MEEKLTTIAKKDISTLFSDCRKVLERVSNSGYTLMVNFSIMGYEHFECTFHDSWKEQYDLGNFLLEDPVFRWALANEGEARWSEIQLPDPLQVLKKSQRYGLGHVDKWWSQSRIDVMSMNPKKLSAVLS